MANVYQFSSGPSPEEIFKQQRLDARVAEKRFQALRKGEQFISVVGLEPETKYVYHVRSGRSAKLFKRGNSWFWVIDENDPSKIGTTPHETQAQAREEAQRALIAENGP